MNRLRVYPTRNAAAHAAAAQIVAAAERAITTRGRFSIALAGGSTPRDVYRLLASEEYLATIDWQRTHVFWGDERAVPLNDHENNGHMARESLLNEVPIPMCNIYRIESQLPPEDAAHHYERTLREFFSARGVSVPRFDLLLLGMGADGHTASLFPHSPALHERERWVVAVYVDKLDSWRITLTPPALNSAAQVMFLVIGAEKADALHHVLDGAKNPDEYPAQIIDPPQGQVTWITDKAAAALVKSGGA